MKNKKVVIGIIVIIVAVIGIIFLYNNYGMNGNDYKDDNNVNRDVVIQENDE